jgi:hypothetical protein
MICLHSKGTKPSIAILLALAITSVFSTCKKRFGCDNTVYSFQTNIKAYPDYDSLRVNDTIWLEFKSSIQLKDSAINKVIDYGQAENLGTAIAFVELIGGNFSDPGVKPAADSFSTELSVGKSAGSILPHQVREFLFKELSGYYVFKVGVVAKAKGEYCIGPSDAEGVYRRNDKCTKAYFRITFKDTNQHLYYYERNRPGYSPSEYELSHMYCFKVY